MRRYAGLLLVVLSAATFSSSGSFATALLAAGWTPGAAVTIRVCTAALVLTPPALWLARGRWPALRRETRVLLVYGLCTVAGCQLAFFYAVQHLSVGVALLLEYSGSLLVVLWQWVHDGHRPGRRTVVGASVCVVGLVLVLDVLSGAHVDVVGVLFGLGAAVGLAMFYVLSARTDTEVPPLVNAWAGLAVGAVGLVVAGSLHLFPLAANREQVVLADTSVSWAVPVLGLSLVAAVIPYTAGISGARLIGAKVASFVGLTEVLFAMVCAYLLVDQGATSMQLVGGVVVLTGIALVKADEMPTPEPAQPHALDPVVAGQRQAPL
jgi:drug/metabolite transporter (DMT)-like permease